MPKGGTKKQAQPKPEECEINPALAGFDAKLC